MFNNKNVHYGNSLIDINGREITHRVTSISIDNMSHMATIVIEKGLKVEVVKISMDFAQHIGFINMDVLLPYCK